MIELLHVEVSMVGLVTVAHVRYRFDGNNLEVDVADALAEVHAKNAAAEQHQETAEELEEMYEKLLNRCSKLSQRMRAAEAEAAKNLSDLQERTRELLELRAIVASAAATLTESVKTR